MTTFAKLARAARVLEVVALLGILVLGACTDAETQKTRLVEAGNKYFESGKYKEASIIYRKAIQKDARYGEAYYRLGLTELKLGRIADALRWLRRASELQPNNDDAHSQLADLYMGVYVQDPVKYKQILEEYKTLTDGVLKRNPNSFTGLRMRGFQFAIEKNIPEAIETFLKADAVKPGDDRVNLALVQALNASGKADEASERAKAFIAKNKSAAPFYDFLYVKALDRPQPDIPAAEAILKSKVANNPKQAIYHIELAAHYAKLGTKEQMRAELDKLIGDHKNFPDARQTVGDFYFRLGDFASASREFEAGVKEDAPRAISYRKRLVEMAAMQGRRSEALDLADRLIKDAPSDSEAQAIRASLRMRGGTKSELEDSIKELQNVISRMPDNPVVRFNLGEALMSHGDLEPARLQFTEAIKLRPNYLQPRVSLARLHLARNEFPRVIQMSDEALQLSKLNIPARLLRATALMGQNELGAARQELNIIGQIDPKNRDGVYLRANLAFAEKKTSEAEGFFRELYTMNPPDMRGLFGLAELSMVSGKPDQARALLQKELSNGKDKRPLTLALANIDVRTKQYDEALKLYLPLLAETPDSIDLNLRVGEVYLRAQRYQDSRKYFEKARDLAPRNIVPLLKLGSVYEHTGERNKLIPIFEAVLKIQPDNALALNNVAYYLAETGGDLDQALTYAQRAKQQLPTNVDVADTLGWIYIKKNLSDDAIRIFRDLLQKDPDRVAWRYHLAMALFQKGDKLEARKEVDLALRKAPNKDEEKQLRDLMQRIG
jgi:tetratricopeptide (TPR) repeat protein